MADFVSGECFDSFDAFAAKLSDYQFRTKSVFRIHKSVKAETENKRRKEKIPELMKYSYVSFVCVHYGKAESKSTGVRPKQRYLGSGCQASLSLCYTKKGVLQVTALSLDHNHDHNESDYPFYSKTRRLTDGEATAASEVIGLKMKNKDLRHYLHNRFGKCLTTQDVVNLKGRLKGECAIGDVEQLQKVLLDVESSGGKISIKIDDSGKLMLVCFSSSDMLHVGAAYPEVLFIDGTYKVNKYGYPLYQIMVHDAIGRGRSIMYAFLYSENAACIEDMMCNVITFYGDVKEKMKIVFVDKDFKEIEALKNVFGSNTEVLLCIFHVIKVFKKKVSELVLPVEEKKELMVVLKKIVYADTEDEITKLLDKVKNMHEGLYQYMLCNWMNCTRMWALCHRKNLLTLGNNTTNFVESENAKIKADLTDSISMSAAVRVLLRRDQEQQNYRSFAIHRQACYSIQYRDMPDDINSMLCLFSEAAGKYICNHLRKSKFVTSKLDADGLWKVISDKKQLLVCLDGSGQVCLCSFFSNLHLPCRHMVEIARKQQIPLPELAKFCANRWLRDSCKAVAQYVSNNSTYTMRTKCPQPVAVTLSANDKYSAITAIMQRINLLVTECGMEDFVKRRAVLSSLLASWEEGKDVVIQNETAVSNLNEKMDSSSIETGLSSIESKCESQQTGNKAAKFDSKLSQCVKTMYLPQCKRRGRPKRSKCWLHFNATARAKRGRIFVKGKGDKGKQAAAFHPEKKKFIISCSFAKRPIVSNTITLQRDKGKLNKECHGAMLSAVLNVDSIANVSECEQSSVLDQAENVPFGSCGDSQALCNNLTAGDTEVGMVEHGCEALQDHASAYITLPAVMNAAKVSAVSRSDQSSSCGKSAAQISDSQSTCGDFSLSEDRQQLHTGDADTLAKQVNLNENLCDESDDVLVLGVTKDSSLDRLPLHAISITRFAIDVESELSYDDFWNVSIPGEWLSSCHMNVAQGLLKGQFPSMDGLQLVELFAPVEDCRRIGTPAGKFIQIINVNYSHWICVSNVFASKRGHMTIYDSMAPGKMSPHLVRSLARLLFFEGKEIVIDWAAVQRQRGSSDCGVFAIAFATELCWGFNPSSRVYDQLQLREATVNCFKNRSMVPFPGTQKSVHRGSMIKSEKFSVYCKCRQPWFKNDERMAECIRCKEWFHQSHDNIKDTVFSMNHTTYVYVCNKCVAKV